MGEIKTMGIDELSQDRLDGFRNIKPEQGTTLDKAKGFMDGLFNENVGNSGSDIRGLELEKTIKDYWEDMKNHSEYPNTISEKPFESSSIERRPPEENAILREEFIAQKAQLKQEWAKKACVPWPKYDRDVYSSSGRLIRKAGSDYDAHHKKPLCIGGENTVDNITPLHADVHYDSQGVHAPGSPCDKMFKMMEVQ